MHCSRSQWRMVVIVTVCALFVTSHCDVKFTFQIQRFGEGFWHNAYHYTRTLLIHCCVTYYVIILTLNYQHSNLNCRCKILCTQRYDQAIITAKISDCTLKPSSKTRSAVQQRCLELQKQSARMSLWIPAVEPRSCAPGIAHTQGCLIETRQ